MSCIGEAQLSEIHQLVPQIRADYAEKGGVKRAFAELVMQFDEDRFIAVVVLARLNRPGLKFVALEL